MLCSTAGAMNKTSQPARYASGLAISFVVGAGLLIGMHYRRTKEAARRGGEQGYGLITSVPDCSGYAGASVEIHTLTAQEN
jgi:hypothetical protein